MDADNARELVAMRQRDKWTFVATLVTLALMIGTVVYQAGGQEVRISHVERQIAELRAEQVRRTKDIQSFYTGPWVDLTSRIKAMESGYNVILAELQTIRRALQNPREPSRGVERKAR